MSTTILKAKVFFIYKQYIIEEEMRTFTQSSIMNHHT